jgi:hypothetical protein
VSGCRTVIHNGSVGMVRGTKVSYDSGVVVMGVDEITVLHPREMGKQMLSPPLEAVSSSLMDSSG